MLNFGDFQMFSNLEYLEFTDMTLWTLILVPFMYKFLALHTVLFMCAWTQFSFWFFLIALIITSIAGISITLTDEEHDMSWDSFMERHMTSYAYDE